VQEFYTDSDERTIAEQREQWKDIWTAEESLDCWLEYMKIAGMKSALVTACLRQEF